ncbi:hypothetical protein HMPREF9056_02136 [Actinomyces sp. oral taxon 170 str. F0386]|nr:hypothetical protein HMPREF9056_02136 [Actinomyces sp. oral taxon 170 str. F0386]
MTIGEPADNRWGQKAGETGQPGHDGQPQPGRETFDVVGRRVGHGYGDGAACSGDGHSYERSGDGGEQEGDAHAEGHKRSTPGDDGAPTDGVDDPVAHQAPHDHRPLERHKPKPHVAGCCALLGQEQG